jgi:hypothetical protein
MNGEWEKAYDLADDQQTVEAVQRATLTTRDFGLVPEVALFGTPEWWKAVEDGRIPKVEVRGIISKLYMTGHGDWPEFEVDSEGSKTKWTRYGNQSLYQEGRGVRVEYVVQRAKKARLGKYESKRVLRVFIQTK